MIQVITGRRGSGKTKILLGMIDDAVKASSGDIICIEKCMKLTYSVNMPLVVGGVFYLSGRWKENPASAR